MNETEKIAQLTEAIQALTQAVASNEKRYQRIEGRFRWLGIGVVALLAVVALSRFDWVERSYAAKSPDTTSGVQAGSSSPPPSCEDMAKQMPNTPSFMSMIGAAGLNCDAIRKLLAGLDDAMVVMGRVRQDSDLLRAYALAHREPPDPAVQQVLAKYPLPVDPALSPTPLNSLDASPSIMVHRGIEHLSVMAGNLRTMAYSMGSTMGRMGSWMP
ncbi:MAG: hypothetical protein H7836_12975 [Magnetococcus sp. YQC-3]